MDADRTSRAYDVVVFGVTGFTGTLVLEYVARLAREGRLDARVRWAAAGRSAAKVREVVRRHCTAVGGPEMAVVEARVEDERSVFAMAGSAWVVMSCVGPYADMGEPVVKACVSMGADYVDVTGEALWVAAMKKRYGDAAKRNGVVLVPFAGHDSVPADLAAWFALTQILPDELKTSHAAVAVVTKFVGRGISNGTLKTGLQMIQHVEEIDALTPPPKKPAVPRLADGVVTLDEVPTSHGGPLPAVKMGATPDAYAVWLTHEDETHAPFKAAQLEVVHLIAMPFRVAAYAARAGAVAAPYLLKLPGLAGAIARATDSGWGPALSSVSGGRVAQGASIGGCSTFCVVRLYPERGGLNAAPLDRVCVRVDEDRDPYLVTAITVTQVALFLAGRRFVSSSSSSAQGPDAGVGPTDGGFKSTVNALGGQNLLERCFECFRVQRLDSPVVAQARL